MNEAISVRRHEIALQDSSSISRSPSPGTRAELTARLSKLYDDNESLDLKQPADTNLSNGPSATYKSDGSKAQAPAEDEGHAFRLFSARPDSFPSDPGSRIDPESHEISSKTAGVVHVRMRSASPAASGSIGLVSSRPRKHYFTDSASLELKQQLELSAVSGEAVRAQALHTWPGCSMPWRVCRTGVMSGKHPNLHLAELQALNSDPTKSGKQRRVGKKRRIALRRKSQEKKEAQLKRHKFKEDKEAAEREKRTRLNRTKNIRRRAKEKAKRSARNEGQGIDVKGDQ